MGASPSVQECQEWRGVGEERCRRLWADALGERVWRSLSDEQRVSVLDEFCRAVPGRVSMRESHMRNDWWYGGTTVTGEQYYERGNVGAPHLARWEFRIDALGNLEYARESK